MAAGSGASVVLIVVLPRQNPNRLPGFQPEKLVKENELAAIGHPAACDRGAFDMVLQELVGKHARKCLQDVKPFLWGAWHVREFGTDEAVS
jgi:hypothetical protein